MLQEICPRNLAGVKPDGQMDSDWATATGVPISPGAIRVDVADWGGVVFHVTEAEIMNEMPKVAAESLGERQQIYLAWSGMRSWRD